MRFQKVFLALALLIAVGLQLHCDDGSPTEPNPSVSPSPSSAPTPVLKNPCDILRTDIYAQVDDVFPAWAWPLGEIATLTAEVSYRGNPPDDLDPLTPPQPPFDPLRCEALDIVTWVLPQGPSAPRMELQGNLNRNKVRLQVYEAGSFLIKVIPQGITAPPGEASFKVQPSGLRASLPLDFFGTSPLRTQRNW